MVDGSGLDGLTVDGARDRVRGKKGTAVVLTIQRGTDAPFDVSIVRDVIVQREVIERDLAGGRSATSTSTGFSDNAASQFHEALKADVDAGRTKIILDLRGNPGGYVTAARQITSEFIGSGRCSGRRTPTATRSRPSDVRRRRDLRRHRARRPRRPRQRLGERDRRGGASGSPSGDARRRDDVRQGHRSAVDRAPGQRRAEADDRQVADARQALDPPRRDRPEVAVPAPEQHERRTRTRRSTGRSSCSSDHRRGRARCLTAPDAHAT